MVVDTDIWVTTKGYLGEANAEVVRLESHVALLKKCNDRLERECAIAFSELKVIVSTLHMKYMEATKEKRQSIFHYARNRLSVMHNLDEMNSIAKEERVQLTFHRCFTKPYKTMFHLKETHNY